MTISYGHQRRTEALEEPLDAGKDVPWAVREDWARGVVRCDTRGTLRGAWGFAFLWNLISSPAAYFVPQEVVDKENYLALLGLVFPAVGVLLVFWAVRATARYRKFGVSELHLRAVPVRPGDFLSGVVRVSSKLQPADGFRARLTCIRSTVTGSGEDRRTRERVLWQEEQVIDRELEGADLITTTIPVSFGLPDDASECTVDNKDDRTFWLLEVGADVLGLDYAASFEVPVFRAGEVEPLAPDYAEGEDWAARYRRPDAVRPLSPWGGTSAGESKIRVEPGPDGGKEFYFPAARNVGAAMGLSLFTMLWSGGIWLMLELGAPLLFPLVFGLFDLILIFACLTMWLGSTRTRVDRRSITVAHRILGVGTTKTIDVADVADLYLHIGMQSGRTPYYDLRVKYCGDRTATLGSSVRSKRDAEWLLEEMRTALGVGERQAVAV